MSEITIGDITKILSNYFNVDEKTLVLCASEIMGTEAQKKLESDRNETIVIQHKEIKQLAYDAVAFLEQLEDEGEFKFWNDGYNWQVLNEIKEAAKKLGIA